MKPFLSNHLHDLRASPQLPFLVSWSSGPQGGLLVKEESGAVLRSLHWKQMVLRKVRRPVKQP